MDILYEHDLGKVLELVASLCFELRVGLIGCLPVWVPETNCRVVKSLGRGLCQLTEQWEDV